MRLRYSLILMLLVCFVALPFLSLPANADTYTYTLIGPLYDDGSVIPDGSINVNIRYINGAILNFSMTNAGSTANITTLSSSTRATEMIWSQTIPLNYTRVYTFLSSGDGETVYLHEPNFAETPAYIYTFNVADFYGMQNPYLETSISNGTGVNVVERQSLNTTGIVSFVLTQYYTYSLTFRCDQGVYTQTFLASNTFINNLQVLGGAFPNSYTNSSDVSAIRLNSTTITINYSDPDLVTEWLYIRITHIDGVDIIEDFSVNETLINSYSNTATVDNETDYYVQVQTLRYNVITEYDIACPILYAVNPFTGLLDFLGSWPTGFDPSQLIASGIILLCLGLGSFKSAGVSCILAWLIGGIMIVIGWWETSIPLWTLAGVLSIFVMIDEGKSTTRDA